MTRLRTLSTRVAWTGWTAAAFDRALDERRPVLLWIGADWCGACREMDRTSFADPSIATAINERFVPVRVDADARPDIAERYGLGGWPTTAFLSPSGHLLGGGTFIPMDRMGRALEQVLEAFDAAGPVDAPIPPPDTPPLTSDPAALTADLTAGIMATFDDRHGGFGPAPKFPHAAPIRLALAGCDVEGRTAAEDAMVINTLDAMGWGGLFDDVDGGFFHYAAGADWSAPHTAKRLDTNAELIRLYLDAGAVLGLTRFTDRAADALRYVQTWLADPEGGWYGAQHAAPGDGQYYAAAPPARQALAAPPVTRQMYADSTAAMVSAALQAADVFADDGLRQFAITSLERVLLAGYKPGDGVSHYHDGQRRCRGLLADQVAMAAACLDAHEVTGNVVYGMMAEELMHFAARTLWDEASGGFFDRAAGEDAADAIGLLGTPLRPFVENCAAAGVLKRLAGTSGDHEFSHLGGRTLAAMAPLAPAQGPLAAHYLLAVRGL